MRLSNYWWLILWLFTGGILLYLIFPRKQEIVLGKAEERWYGLPAVLLVLPYVIWAGYRGDVADTYAYRQSFKLAPGSLSQLGSYLDTVSKDKGFSVLTVLIKSIIGNNDILYLLIIATFQMGALMYVYRKYSCDFWLSIFLFVASGEYISWFQNGIRQFTAIAVILLGTGLLLKKKYVPLIILILLASTLHASALVMIPIVFIVQGKAWNKKTILSIILSAIVIAFAGKFTTLLDTLLSDTQYSSMVTDWTTWGDTGTNPIRVLVYSLPMIISLFGYKQIREVNDPLINIMVNFSILTTAIALVSMVTSGIFIGRMIIYASVYSTGVLLPWEIKNLFTKESSLCLMFIMIFGYIVFFYYQTHTVWGIL